MKKKSKKGIIKPVENVKEYILDDAIMSPVIRLIKEDKTSEILPIEQALTQAYEQGLNLVQISAGTTEPICKILDYGKFSYQQKKKEKDKRQKTLNMKEIRLSLVIGVSDIKTKIREAAKLLMAGHKIKFVFRLKRKEREAKNKDEKLFRQKIENIFETHVHPILNETLKFNVDKEITIENSLVYTIYSATQK